MSSRIGSPFGSLGERVGTPAAPAGTPAAPPPTPTPPPGEPPGTAGRGRPRHVVVDGRHPGVLVGWRRMEAGWDGQVAYVLEGRLIVEQVPAGRLRPIPD